MSEDITQGQTQRTNWTLDERVAHQKKLDEERRQWEAEQAEIREAEKRQRLQSSLEAHLRERGKLWLDATGTPPPREVLARWQDEYVENLASEQELDHEVRLAQAEDIWG